MYHLGQHLLSLDPVGRQLALDEVDAAVAGLLAAVVLAEPVGDPLGRRSLRSHLAHEMPSPGCPSVPGEGHRRPPPHTIHQKLHSLQQMSRCYTPSPEGVKRPFEKNPAGGAGSGDRIEIFEPPVYLSIGTPLGSITLASSPGSDGFGCRWMITCVPPTEPR